MREKQSDREEVKQRQINSDEWTKINQTWRRGIKTDKQRQGDKK